LTRDVEGEILDTARALNISLIPYSPHARGLVTNTLDVNSLDESDFRKTLPRYSGENLANNQSLAAEFAAMANDKQITPAQLALAWVLAQGKDMIPIPGTKKRKYLEENAKAVDVHLSQSDLDEIQKLMDKYPNTGQRYSEGALKLVNN
jgi:aryl-alcohol dehydrogenase-like predicted oxidoreductase